MRAPFLSMKEYSYIWKASGIWNSSINSFPNSLSSMTALPYQKRLFDY